MIQSEPLENECTLTTMVFINRKILLDNYFAVSFLVEENALLNHSHYLRS